jgi:hypothetical protein
MRYRINRQGYGTLVDSGPVTVTGELVLEVEIEEATVKLVTGAKGSPFYSAVREGGCRFPREALVGDIGVSIITNRGVIPCTSLVAVETKSGVMVFPDARDVLERLDRAERDISECLAIIERLEGKYDDLDDRLKRLFVGYEM